MVRSRKTAANKVKLERSPAKLPSRDGPTQYSAGVVGMGLMGTSISACLLGAGHSLHCVETNAARRRSARARLLKLLTHAAAEGAMREKPSTLIGGSRFPPTLPTLNPRKSWWSQRLKTLPSSVKSSMRSKKLFPPRR